MIHFRKILRILSFFGKKTPSDPLRFFLPREAYQKEMNCLLICSPAHLLTFSLSHLLFLIISLFFCLLAAPVESAFIDNKVGTRPLGMGGAFVALADEPCAAMWNPAGLAQLKQTEIVATYAALYTGLGEDRLGHAYIGYTLPLKNSGALGINYIRLQSPLYRENTIVLSCSKRLRFLYLGLNAKGLFANFVENEYTKIDPLFRDNGLWTKAFSIDLGLLLNVKDVFSFGVFAQNLNQPNIALGEDEESIVPLELNAGIALRSLNVNPSLDFTFRNNKIRGKQDINFHFGLETWLLNNDIGLRAGADLYELAVGASYSFKDQDSVSVARRCTSIDVLRRKHGVELQVDYAFRYPMPFQLTQAPITDTTGSHQFSLSLRFGGVKKPEKKLGPALQEALSYQETGDQEAAIKAYKQVLQQDNTNQEAHFLLAGLYTKLKQYDKAIIHYKLAIEIDRDEPRFHYALGRLYEQYGDDTGNRSWHNKAIIEFTKTRMLNPDYNDIPSRLEKIRSKKGQF